MEEARDLREVAALHRDYSGRFDGTALRDADAWRGNLRYAGNSAEYFVVCRRDTSEAPGTGQRSLQHPPERKLLWDHRLQRNDYHRRDQRP